MTTHTSVKGCVRCGGDHLDLLLRPFERNGVETTDGVADYWAPCPNNGEPLLIVVTVGGDTGATSHAR